MANFMNKFNAAKAAGNKFIAPIAIIVMVLSLVGWIPAGLFIKGSVVLLVAWAFNFIWFVPTGYVGFKTVMGKVKARSYEHGINVRIPIITDTFLTDLQPQIITASDTKKVITRNDVELKFTMTFQVDSRYAHLLFRFFGVNYWSKMSEWIDAVFDTFVSRLTYPQLQTQKEQIEKIVTALCWQEIDRMCSKASEGIKELVTVATGGSTHEVERPISHVACRYSVKTDDTIAIGLDEDGSTENIPKLELEEWTETVEGVCFFSFFDLKINKVRFEEGYEKARADVAIEKVNVKKTELENKQTISRSEALATAMKNKTDAQSYAHKKELEAVGGDVNVYMEIKKSEQMSDAIKHHSGTLYIGVGSTPVVPMS